MKFVFSIQSHNLEYFGNCNLYLFYMLKRNKSFLKILKVLKIKHNIFFIYIEYTLKIRIILQSNYEVKIQKWG